MNNMIQDEKTLEELVKTGEDFRVFMTNLADELAKALADIKALKKEEDTWEMKCPYKVGDEYWIICDSGEFEKVIWNDYNLDKEVFKTGNAFSTREAALLEAKRRNLLTRFRAFRDECNDGWVPDFSYEEEKYYLYYSTLEECIDVGWIIIGCSFNIFGYFKNPKDAQRAIELFGGEIKELFMEGDV